MKQIKIIFGTTLAFMICMGIFSSCVRERDTDLYHAEDLAFAQWVYHDAAAMAHEASLLGTGDQLGSYKTQGFCATITNDQVSSPRVLTIDFDSTNCLCFDGRLRRGSISITYNGDFGDSNEVHIFEFTDYYVNDYKVYGDMSITPMGSNTSGHTIENLVASGEILFPDTLSILTWNAEQVRTKIEGASTVILGDDVVEISGTANGKNGFGQNYGLNITEPLIKKNNYECKYISQGSLDIQPQGRTFRQLDFGDGSCDKNVVVTIDTKTFNIDMQ